MKNFTVIEKKHGNAWGFWFAELADAQNKELVAALSSKQGWPNKLCAMALLGDYEIWRNTFGAGGGYLVLFGKEEISVLCLTEPAYQRGDKKKYGLLQCRCGSLYRGHFDPDMEVGLLCGCGLAVDMPKVATSLAHDPQSGEPPEEGGVSRTRKRWRWLYRRLWKPLCIICLVLLVILFVILLLLGGLALIVKNIHTIIGVIIPVLAVLLAGLGIGYLIETEDLREAKREERNAERAKRAGIKKQIQLNKDVEVITSAIKKLVSSQKPIENFLPIINTKGYESVVSVNYEAIAKAILSVDSLKETEKGRLFSNVEPDFISHILNYFNDSEKITILQQIEQGKRDDVLMRFSLSKRSQLREALKE